jgi:ABC-2 type transport system ATP-binding protein
MATETAVLSTARPAQDPARLPPIIEFVAVNKRFGETAVLRDVNLAIRAGEIFGLVGPSGSGKTTLVKLIVGLLSPTSGDVWVDGIHPSEFNIEDKRHIGYVPQEFSLYPSLSVLENARFMAGVYGIGWLKRRRRLREILRFLDLWDARHRKAQDLSGGMKRRMAFAAGILHNPVLFVVDEPTAGLDPDLRARIWDLLRAVRDRGTTILMTTQYIEEAENCDSVGILSKGRILGAGDPGEIRDRVDIPDEILVEASGLTSSIVEALWSHEWVVSVGWDRRDRLAVRVAEATTSLPLLQAFLVDHGCVVTLIESRSATFEEVFTSMTRNGH